MRSRRAQRRGRGRSWGAVAIGSVVSIAGLRASVGCSAGGPSGGAEERAPSGGGEAGGTASSSTGTGGEGEIVLDGGPPDGEIGDAACVATSLEATPIPLDMLLLVDRSGSMAGSKWSGSTSALLSFVNDVASAGIRVSLSYFPVDHPPDNQSCNYRHYREPAVPLGILPDNAVPIAASIEATDAAGASTPTYGALEGVLFAATAEQDAHPDHKVVVVLSSDGDPNSCTGNQNDIDVIAGLAASALNYNGVRTYVIAVAGSTVASLDKIAAAGGTGASFDVTQDVGQLGQKMAEIRAAALGCELSMPEPPDGHEIDPTKVNIALTPGGQPLAETLPRAEDAADCMGNAGWYYDDNASPSKIELCPATCAAVQADKEATLQVLLGCKTEVN